MRYTIFFFLAFVVGASLQAQTVTVSEELALRNDVGYYILGKMKDRILLFRDHDSDDFEVQAFNEKMRKTWSKDILLDEKSPELLAVSPAYDWESFRVFYRFRRNSHTVIKAHHYDPAANLIDSLTVRDCGFLFYTPEFKTIFSEDRSKVLIYYIEKNSIIQAVMYDADQRRTMWKRAFQPRDFNTNRGVLHMTVSNRGSLHMAIEKDNSRSKREDHHYEIHHFNSTNGKYIVYDIPFPTERLTYDIKFTYDNLNDRMVACGMYSDKNPSRALGYFVMRIQPRRSEQYLLEFHEFDRDFVATLLGKEVDEDEGLVECSVQNIVLRQDGGILLIGERNRQYERRLAGSSRVVYDGYNRYIVDYYYDDVFVISIHPDGRPHWKTVLHKKQYSQDDNGVFSSYCLLRTPSNLRFIFNDEISYENTVSEYVLNGGGHFDRNSVLSTENLKLRLRFRDALQIDSDAVIVPSERRSNLRLVKLEF